MFLESDDEKNPLVQGYSGGLGGERSLSLLIFLKNF